MVSFGQILDRLDVCYSVNVSDIGDLVLAAEAGGKTPWRFDEKRNRGLQDFEQYVH